MTSLLAVLLIIAVAFVIASVIALKSKNELIAGFRRTIQDKRDDCNTYLDRWRNRVEQITDLTVTNDHLTKMNKSYADENTRLRAFEYEVPNLRQQLAVAIERKARAEADSRAKQELVQRSFDEFQELLTITRATVPAKVIEKGQEEGQSIKDIVRAYLQQVAERKAARRG